MLPVQFNSISTKYLVSPCRLPNQLSGKTYSFPSSVHRGSLFHHPKQDIFLRIISNQSQLTSLKKLKSKEQAYFDESIGLFGGGVYVTLISDLFLSPITVHGMGKWALLAGLINPCALYFFGCSLESYSRYSETKREIKDIEKDPTLINDIDQIENDFSQRRKSIYNEMKAKAECSTRPSDWYDFANECEGCEQLDEAIKWHTKAAKEGYRPSMLALRRISENS